MSSRRCSISRICYAGETAQRAFEDEHRKTMHRRPSHIFRAGATLGGQYAGFDHLLDVAGTLKRVRQLMTPHGRLFIDIVDFRAAYLRNWSVEDATKIDHPYYLTEVTIGAFLRRAGFDVLRSDYAADHLHISYLCSLGTPVPDALPDPASVAESFREIRFVQNAPRRA